MARKVDLIAALVTESHELADLGRQIQGDRELLASEEEIDEQVERYHAWYAQTLNVVPD